MRQEVVAGWILVVGAGSGAGVEEGGLGVLLLGLLDLGGMKGDGKSE